MLDEKLIKFLALQRIHQLFPSRVQTSPGSVGAHPLASGGHHTEGAHAHLPHTPPSDLCVNGHLPSVEISLSVCAFNGLIKHHGSLFFSENIQNGTHSFQLRLQEVHCNFLSYISTLRLRKQLQVPLGVCSVFCSIAVKYSS